MCDFTKQPYAECDPETFDDKAFIFFEEKPALDFVDDYKEDKMMLHVEKVARTSILAFLTTLIVEGINMVCFRGEEEHNRAYRNQTAKGRCADTSRESYTPDQHDLFHAGGKNSRNTGRTRNRKAV